MKKTIAVIWCAVFMAAACAPAAATLFREMTGGKGNIKEETTEVSFPQFRTRTGEINRFFLSDLGNYYTKNFSGRDPLTSIYSAVLEKGMQTSSDEGVIVGKEGWLYYADSLDGFQGVNVLTERQAFCAARSLKLFSDYLKENGTLFVLSAVPDKASVYGEYMPERLRKGKQKITEGSYEILMRLLDREGVKTTDLKREFLDAGKEIPLYRKRDSHWNGVGAAMGAEAILASLGKETTVSFLADGIQDEEEPQGDLDRMLYPSILPSWIREKEVSQEPVRKPVFEYAGEKPASNFDYKIRTTGVGNEKLTVWRDSFANALLPFLSEVFAESYFTRAIPRDALDAVNNDADCAVLEIAERFLNDLPSVPPAFPAPAATEAWDMDFIPVTVNETEDGDYLIVTGNIPSEAGSIDTYDRVYLRDSDGWLYEACPVTDDTGNPGFTARFLLSDGYEKDMLSWEVAVGTAGS